jgi:hypothetical protein
MAPGTTLRRTISDRSSIPLLTASAPEVPTGMSLAATKTVTFVSSRRTSRW